MCMRAVHARETRPNPGSTVQPSVRSHDPRTEHSVCIGAREIRIGSVSPAYELAASVQAAMEYLVRALRCDARSKITHRC